MADFDVDAELIRKLADLLRESGLTEIEFAEGEKRIRITRAAVVAAAPSMPPSGPAQGLPNRPAAAPSPPSAVPQGAVTSPMVGTAYLAPEPDAPPFVRPGDTVSAGQTVLIIEAMKVMNPIKAQRAGTVSQILVSDAQPVEFGEPLLIIE